MPRLFRREAIVGFEGGLPGCDEPTLLHLTPEDRLGDKECGGLGLGLGLGLGGGSKVEGQPG